MVPTYVFAEQCSSKLKETDLRARCWFRAWLRTSRCTGRGWWPPPWWTSSSAASPPGSEASASSSPSSPSSPCYFDFINIRDKKENINMRHGNNQDLAGALEQVHQNEASPPAPRPHRLPPSAAPPPRSLAGCTGSPPAKTWPTTTVARTGE